MKRILLMAASLLLTMSLAQATSDVRIYINPGHGGWGPNDRPMATIPYPNLSSTGRPDTCGFYESNTNLWKCIKLYYKLIDMGVQEENLMMSRWKNGPFPYDGITYHSGGHEYSRNLTEICEEVDANNMDAFISVHSNAATDGTTTNYPIFLYRGKDGAGNDYASGSRQMGITMWGPHWMNELDPTTNFSKTNYYVKGDISFMGSSSTRTGSNGQTYTGYYGVLKHGTPGYINEGFFHTYHPARHRALNSDYCGQEGVRMARGFCEYFGLTPEATGYIMGSVKQLHEHLVNDLYKYNAGTIDQWYPLNGVTVKLLKNGQEVGSYTTDNNYNGIFVFEGLTPGGYTLSIDDERFKPLGTYSGDVSSSDAALIAAAAGTITVTANETTYVVPLVEAIDHVTPENYPDPEQPDGTVLPASFDTEQDYVGEAIDALANKTVRRTLMRDEKAYVLAVESDKTPHIYVIDGKTHTLERELSTTGITVNTSNEGSIVYPLSDIAFTADGVLLACNAEQTQIDASNVSSGYTRGNLRVYKWSNDTEGIPTGSPSTVFTSQLSGNWYNADVGMTMACTGTLQEGAIYVPAITTGSSRQVRILRFSMANGSMTGSIRNQNGTNMTEGLYGVGFSFTVSPRDANNLIIDGKSTTPVELAFNNTDAGAPTVVGTLSSNLLNASAIGADYFKYAGSSLMVSPYTNASGVAGVKLFDITNGLGNATLIATTNTDIDAVSGVTYATAKGAVDGADITLYLNIDGTLSRFTTIEEEEPGPDVPLDENTLSIAEQTVVRGRTLVLPVELDNMSNVSALQADLYLPEGFGIAVDEDDNSYEVTLNSTRKGSDHTIACKQQPDGGYRVLISSQTSQLLNGNSGELFYVTLTTDATLAVDTYTVELRNIVLSTENGIQIDADDVEGSVVVNAILQGDANGDDHINVADYVTVANYILDSTTQPFYPDAVDFDGNGNINVADLVREANFILNYVDGSSLAPRRAPQRAPGDPNRFYIEDFDIAPGETKELEIILDNETTFSALQADIHLPEGLSIGLDDWDEMDFELTDRKGKDHTIGYQEHDGNMVRILISSQTSKELRGNSGALVTFSVVATADFTGEHTIVLDNIVGSPKSGQEVLLGNETCYINKQPAVETVTLAEALDGEEGDVALSDVLKVVEVKDGVAYASNGNEWVTLTGIDEVAANDYLTDVTGSISGLTTLPVIAVTGCDKTEEVSFSVAIEDYELATLTTGDKDFVVPAAAQVATFSGFVFDGYLRGYSNNTGESLKLAGSEDLETGKALKLTVAIEKDAAAAGAPRRAQSSEALKGMTAIVLKSEVATGIDGIAIDRKADGTYYNLLGQPVKNPTPGIYILDGKKVVVK